jgi:hypothetical protein
MQRIAIVLAVLTIVGFGQTQSKAPASNRSGAIPRFEDFKVPTPLPPRQGIASVARPGPQGPGLPDETAAQLNSRLREAAKEGPDFAGHYAVVQWGCGSNCVNMVIVDVQTGSIYSTPFLGVAGGFSVPLTYRLDSRLFVVTGRLEIVDVRDHSFHDGPFRRFFYYWNGNRLKLVTSVDLPCCTAPDVK